MFTYMLKAEFVMLVSLKVPSGLPPPPPLRTHLPTTNPPLNILSPKTGLPRGHSQRPAHPEGELHRLEDPLVAAGRQVERHHGRGQGQAARMMTMRGFLYLLGKVFVVH